jgi:hypothetical protein
MLNSSVPSRAQVRAMIVEAIAGSLTHAAQHGFVRIRVTVMSQSLGIGLHVFKPFSSRKVL